MQVKLAFAVATSIESEILIVDEVLAVGDLSFQQKCIDRMDTLIRREKRTVLVVSHNIRQIERLCTRALMLDHGRLTHTGTPKDVCGLFFSRTQERSLESRRASGGLFVPQRDAGLVDVLAVDLLDDKGNILNSIEFQKTLTLRIRFRCRVPLPRPEIIIGFHTSDFVQVLSASNAMSGVQPDLEVGEYEVSCRFSEIPLRPFPYGLRIIFVDHRNATIWSAENVLLATVTPGRSDITKFPSTGLVFVSSEWAFSCRDTEHFSQFTPEMAQ
jgi:ABC-type molybdate transport system ATPase subunit